MVTKNEDDGNYYITNPTTGAQIMIREVIADDKGEVWALAEKCFIQEATDGTKIAYTPDRSAREYLGNVYTKEGTQPLIAAPIVDGNKLFAQ